MKEIEVSWHCLGDLGHVSVSPADDAWSVIADLGLDLTNLMGDGVQ